MKQQTSFASALLAAYISLSSGLWADGPQICAPKCIKEVPSIEEGGCCEKNQLFINAAILYWKGHVDGLEYAVSNASSISLSGPTPVVNVDIDFLNLDYLWKPGVKVDLGYYFQDHWELTLDWTYLRSKARGSATARDPTLAQDNLKPNWFPFLLGGIASHASGNWRLNFNTFDLLLGKNYYLKSCVSMHPFVGLRAAWINQKYHTDYRSTFYPALAAVEIHDTSFSAHSEFKGLGLRAGIDLAFNMGQNWSFIGSGSTSAVYGPYDITEDLVGYFTIPTGTINENLIFHENLHQLKPNLETSLGIKWEKSLRDDRYNIAFSFVYDLAYWFRQNQFMNDCVTETPNSSTLTGGNILFSTMTKMADLQIEGITFNLFFGF